MTMTWSEILDLALEGAAETEPGTRTYAERTNGGFSTCFFGAVAYAYLKKKNTCYINHDTINNTAGVIIRREECLQLKQKFAVHYKCQLIEYNDEHGREAAIKAVKDIL